MRVIISALAALALSCNAVALTVDDVSILPADPEAGDAVQISVASPEWLQNEVTGHEIAGDRVIIYVSLDDTAEADTEPHTSSVMVEGLDAGWYDVEIIAESDITSGVGTIPLYVSPNVPTLTAPGGYITITPTYAQPNIEDCQIAAHYGRSLFDPDSGNLYLCGADGWIVK